MKTLHLTISFILLVSAICQGQSSNIPIIDKEKEYPVKEFKPDVQEDFIYLETRDDVLLDQGAHVYYVSDERMLIVNKHRGDVFIFDIKGKCLSHFNHKGGYGYSYLCYAVYDEKKNDIYILDNIKGNILVFKEDGTLKRTLHLTKSMRFQEIHNFDENTLLAYHEYQYGELKIKKPYVFLSKENGKIISHLDITLNKANPRKIMSDNHSIIISGNCSGNCRFGDKFVLASLSSDTIFLLKQDKTLTPLLIQTPSVFSEIPVITSIGMLTDNFISFCTYPYNLKAAKERHIKGEKFDPFNSGIRSFIYDINTKEIMQVKRPEYWAEKIDIPKNMSVELIPPLYLKTWLKRGRLKGKMKEIAEGIDILANPIVKITRFKN